MKKIYISILFFVSCSFLFCEKIYISSDGYFIYRFSDDFSKMETSTIEDPNTSSSQIIQYEENSIQFWQVGNIKYVKFDFDFYFTLVNEEKSYVLIEREKYNEYWNRTREKTGIYKASSEGKIGRQKYDAHNLLYLSFAPWLSDTAEIGEWITFEGFHEVNSICIINGFVDVNSPEKFEKYGKVKKMNVYDEEGNCIDSFDVENTYEVQRFELSKTLSFVKIEIVDIYEGTEFSNLAITMMQFH